MQPPLFPVRRKRGDNRARARMKTTKFSACCLFPTAQYLHFFDKGAFFQGKAGGITNKMPYDAKM